MVNQSLKVFMKKKCKTELAIEKVLKRKGNKLHVIWKAYDNSFNSSIDEKDHEKDHLEVLEKKLTLNLIIQIM